MKVICKNGKELEFEYKPDEFPWYDPDANPKHPKMAHNCEPGWYRQTEKNIYRIFFSDSREPHIWIGRLNVQSNHSVSWFDVRRSLNVVRIELSSSVIYFH